MPAQFPLPRDTRDTVEKYWNECQHLGLILDKYQPWSEVDSPERWNLAVPIERKGESGTAKSGEAKSLWLGVLRRGIRFRGRPVPIRRQGQNEERIEHRINARLLEEFQARWEQMVRAIDPGAQIFPLKTRTRLVVGLGSESTLETAITLHRNYGVPFIPGSALKGLARAYAFYSLAEQLGISTFGYEEFMRRRGPDAKPRRETPLSALRGLLDAEEKDWPKWVDEIAKAGGPPLMDKQLRDMDSVRQFRYTFGWLGRAGGAIFFDAIPDGTQLPRLAVDVMNPHYPKYYQGSEAPHDGQNPQPIPFLAVEAGTGFRFAVAANRKPGDEAFARQGKEWLAHGLKWLGSGAKTASGYGLFA